MAHKTHDAHVIVCPHRGPSGMAARNIDMAKIACQYREDLSGVPVDDPWIITTRIVQALAKAGFTCEVRNLPTLH
jgi:predicted TIM-barrel enzyme